MISELTEKTEIARNENLRGWIFYDGDCRSCIASAKRFERLFARRGFYFTGLQTPLAQEQLGLEPNAPLEEMRVLTRDGRDLGGADAVIFLARQVWWAWPFHALAQLPGVHRLVDRSYRWIATHRGCTHIACATPRAKRWPAWLGLVLLPILALLARNRVAPWIFMWLMAAGIFLGCKWLTFWRAKDQHVDLRVGHAFGYFFLWAGMDAATFLGPHQRLNFAQRRRFLAASTNILLGAFLVFCFARLASNQLLVGWIGMIGLILILHFGIFEFAAIAWRMAGVNATPIMSAPLKATSLSEFWGRRWNGAFNELVGDVFFRPFTRSTGVIRATLAVFLFSGLLHELVISLPARAGYGLPTAYFLLQGCGVVAQRRFRLGHGVCGWIFTMLIVAGPAFWLFHPPFVRHVILPFMQAIHAL
jgi:predicted DCC family thiol-disulfide oxidoreductase YuxK